MRLTIKGTKYELSDEVKRYIEERIGGLEKFLPKIDPSSVLCRVEVSMTTKHHRKGDIFRAEINLDILGDVWRAEAMSDDIYAAIDEARDELKREMIERKHKVIDKNLRPARQKRE